MKMKHIMAGSSSPAHPPRTSLLIAASPSEASASTREPLERVKAVAFGQAAFWVATLPNLGSVATHHKGEARGRPCPQYRRFRACEGQIEGHPETPEIPSRQKQQEHNGTNVLWTIGLLEFARQMQRNALFSAY